MVALTYRGRFPAQQKAPEGGITRSLSGRNYDVQQFTGYATSTVPGGNWDRGQLYRFDAPVFRPTREPVMYDPTKPDTWPRKY